MKPCHQDKCIHYQDYEIKEGANIVSPLACIVLESSCQNCIYYERFNLFLEK